MGIGWTSEDWAAFDRAQKEAANTLQKASEKIDKSLVDKTVAEKAGKESKAFKSESNTFEKTFGKRSATPENMKKVSETYKQMVAALRDDGTKGHVANAMTKQDVARMGLNPGTFGKASLGGLTLEINIDHPLFNKQSELSWTAGHEASHNVGVADHAYKQEPEYNSLTPEQRLDNADSYMDFAQRQ